MEILRLFYLVYFFTILLIAQRQSQSEATLFRYILTENGRTVTRWNQTVYGETSEICVVLMAIQLGDFGAFDAVVFESDCRHQIRIAHHSNESHIH